MKMFRLFFVIFSTCVLLGTANTAQADDAEFCARETKRFERLENIPKGLLQSLSLVETGRTNKQNGEYFAWPWTINAAGEGFFYTTKSEAVAAARDFLAAGVESIDVGCMQINLKYHPTAFNSLEEAFSPHHNVAYATRFVKQLYDRNGDWMTAAKHYHSTATHKNVRYGNKVKTVLASLSGGKLPGFISEVAGAQTKTAKSVATNKQAERTIAAKKARAWRARRLAEYHRKKAKQQSRNL